MINYIGNVNITPLNPEDGEFTGKKYDSGTGLIYYGARFYDPEVGRFITQDPGKQGLNWYEYCFDNPMKLIDNDGRYVTDPVYYSQKNPQWGSNKYSIYGYPQWETANNGKPQDIAGTGCGPTSVAMVISSLTGNDETPDVFAAAACPKYRTQQVGTDPGFITSKFVIDQGLSATFTTDFNEVVQALAQESTMAIASMGPGDFTSGGHYIVLNQVDSNCNAVSVLDPNRQSNNIYWEDSIIQSQANGYWIYSSSNNNDNNNGGDDSGE